VDFGLPAMVRSDGGPLNFEFFLAAALRFQWRAFCGEIMGI
jgi:hypothetical protein